MRNKIKQILKKEEGFTLVELLAVIVILGIIVAIAIPAIGGVISRADEGADEAENALVLDAARLFYMDSEHDVRPSEVKVGDLYKDGYLDSRDGDLGEDDERMIDFDDDGKATFRESPET